MKLDSAPEPVISIAVITYNHVNWIHHCFQGIEKQNTSFPFEVWIGDDGSSDGTSDICAHFAARNNLGFPVVHQIRDRKNPARAKYESVFMPNVIETLANCRGKYVAIVEGDDLWTDSSKLESQVRFLDENPEYSMVIHNAELEWDPPKVEKRLYVEGSQSPEYDGDRDYSVLDWPRVAFPSCSVVVRREVVRTLVETDLAFGPMWDSTILHIAATQGLIRYLARPMGCYRIHAGGCWNGPLAGNRYEVIMRLVARILRHLPQMSPEVRQWLRTLFDYNYACVADRSCSSSEFQSCISSIFPSGTDDLHLNAWLAQSSADAIVKHVDEARRLRESMSFRLGQTAISIARAPAHCLTWLRRSALG